jgi:hypothetical protein
MTAFSQDSNSTIFSLFLTPFDPTFWMEWAQHTITTFFTVDSLNPITEEDSDDTLEPLDSYERNDA